MYPSTWFRAAMTALIVLMLTVGPFVYYRMAYAHHKRLRIVTAGKVYRSGCMTAQGFRDAIEQYGIRTVINLMDEEPNPPLPNTMLDRRRISESDLCVGKGVRFVFIAPDLVPRPQMSLRRPDAIEEFLKVMDDPASYPVLIHCRAGLHRTGCMAAVYRMEYENWSVDHALRELKGHGFGEYASTSYNDYITQYVLTYRPHQRQESATAQRASVPGGQPTATQTD